jgi:hypothetical protein
MVGRPPRRGKGPWSSVLPPEGTGSAAGPGAQVDPHGHVVAGRRDAGQAAVDHAEPDQARGDGYAKLERGSQACSSTTLSGPTSSTWRTRPTAPTRSCAAVAPSRRRSGPACNGVLPGLGPRGGHVCGKPAHRHREGPPRQGTARPRRRALHPQRRVPPPLGNPQRPHPRQRVSSTSTTTSSATLSSPTRASTCAPNPASP